MRPTESKVHVVEEFGRREVYVISYFTDTNPPQQFDEVKVDARDSAVMLSRKQFDQFFLTKDQVAVLSEAIEQAKG